MPQWVVTKMAKKVALLIGVSEYGEGIPSLSAPINDVTAMKRVLENPDMGGFDEIETRINPDLAEMQKAVQQIFADRRKDDLVLLFFSGHGITDDNNKLYLTTKGTSKDFYQATSVPASFIQDRSSESYAKRQAIVLDCCYSGAFAEGWQAKSVGLDLKKELGAEGRVVLTSSTATQTSFQQEGEELSLYTKYFVEGIETGAADRDEDGKIYAHELHDYAKAKVQEVKPKQKPGIITDREGFNILLSQASVNDPKSDFPKKDKVEQQNKLNKLYKDAHRCYKTGKWQRVIETFQQMQELNLPYFDPDGLYRLARNQILKEEQEAREIQNLYSQGARYLQAKDWNKARISFELILKRKPKDVYLIAQAQDKLAQIQEKLEKKKWFYIGLITIIWFCSGLMSDFLRLQAAGTGAIGGFLSGIVFGWISQETQHTKPSEQTLKLVGFVFTGSALGFILGSQIGSRTWLMVILGLTSSMIVMRWQIATTQNS